MTRSPSGPGSVRQNPWSVAAVRLVRSTAAARSSRVACRKAPGLPRLPRQSCHVPPVSVSAQMVQSPPAASARPVVSASTRPVIPVTMRPRGMPARSIAVQIGGPVAGEQDLAPRSDGQRGDTARDDRSELLPLPAPEIYRLPGGRGQQVPAGGDRVRAAGQSRIAARRPGRLPAARRDPGGAARAAVRPGTRRSGRSRGQAAGQAATAGSPLGPGRSREAGRAGCRPGRPGRSGGRRQGDPTRPGGRAGGRSGAQVRSS